MAQVTAFVSRCDFGLTGFVLCEFRWKRKLANNYRKQRIHIMLCYVMLPANLTAAFRIDENTILNTYEP